MKISTLIIVTVITVLLIFSGYTVFRQNSVNPNDAAEKNKPLIAENSHYVEYSKAAYNQAWDKRRVLFFYASWCPICKPADESFKQNVSRIPEDVFLIRVNYNDPDTDQAEKNLARKYGVVYQHTFVQIDQNENVVTKWNGGEIDELLSEIKFTEKKAAFAIFTNGTFRIFTAAMYHNLSPNAFITAGNPNIITITKPEITWQEFFSTLPFSLTSECLTTGTNETFCSNGDNELKFYLNGELLPTVLGQEIMNGDKLLVTFGNDSEKTLQDQMARVSNPLE
ncbi:redoxin domain-containing protein [Candidatus Roizmanbacteria bacterium]|nr:redoxin domain-containing protein [Candidatus Roizmanbacteria bacterium]